MDASNNGMITQHLEGFLASARKLEEALGEEKKRSQKIAQEYLATRTTLENAVRELQNRLVQRENKIQAIAQAFQNAQGSEGRLRNEIREISEREKKASTELAQYQSAWNEVLARESNARGALIEYEKAKNTLNEQRNHIRTLEAKIAETHQNAATHSRHAETYQRELQSALIRIQSSEAKYSQIQKELSVLSQSKRNADEEIARIETSMKERFRWELATEKERLRAELEKDSALDRERFREIARNQMRSEIERQTLPERVAREGVEAELAQIQIQLSELEAKGNKDMERARMRLLALSEENVAMKHEIDAAGHAKAADIAAMKNEMAMHQMEAGNTQAQLETSRKESNKAMLMERLRHDDEVRDLRMKLDQITERGIYAEKIDAAPEGIRVYSASAVAIARSSRDGNVADHAVKSDESNARL
jgi:chromosome segregation ATPase